MAMQTFWESASNVEFPKFLWGRNEKIAHVIVGMYYVAATNSLLCAYMRHTEIHHLVGLFAGRIQLQKMWRAGEITLVGGTNVPMNGHPVHFPFWNAGIAGTNDGRVLFSPLLSGTFSDRWMFTNEDTYSIGVSATIRGATNIAHGNYYVVEPLWPGDYKIPGAIVDAAVMEPRGVGYIDVANKAGISLDGDSDNLLIVSHVASGSALTSSTLFGPINRKVAGGDLSWRLDRQIIYCDASTSIVTFGVWGGPLNGTNASQPGVVRVFDTKAANTWTLLWEEELPGKAQVAAFDPINRVLYSVGIHQSTAIMYASKLKRTPMTVASASIKPASQTELVPLNQATLSTCILHGSGGVTGHTSFTSVLSGELVQWTLDSGASIGSLASAYSLTNDSGIATVTYYGPANPDAGLTERVNVTTATVAVG